MAEQFLDDGSVGFLHGQDSWRHPNDIQDGYYARGVNVTTKGGVLSPRPSLKQLALFFDKDTFTTRTIIERSVEDIWTAGKAQAFIPQKQATENYLITVVCGLIYRTNIRTNKTVLLSKIIKVNQCAARINWDSAGEYIIIFDFPAYPVIIHGDKVFRSVHWLIPISVMGCYNNSRQFVCDNGISLVGGDPTGLVTAYTAPPTWVHDTGLPITDFVPPLSFSEYLTPSSPYYQQSFMLTAADENYPITAMASIPEPDSSTGIGPMIVATEKQVYFYNVDQPRDQWAKGKISGVLLEDVGVAGPRAIKAIKSDLCLVSPDYEVYLLSTARNDTKRLANVPISREVECYLKEFDPALASLAVVASYQNRILVTARPYAVLAQDRDRQPILDYAHAGFVVLEVANISTFNTDSNPAWAGVWTGTNPIDFATVGNRCFMLAKDGTGTFGANGIYELDASDTVDTVRGNKRRVRSRVYTKEYNAQQPYIYKQEHSISLKIAEITGKFSVSVSRKPTHAMGFSDYGTWRHEAPVETFDMPTDEELNGFAAHNFRHIYFGDADKTGSSPFNQDDYSAFFASQLRVDLEGDYWQLEAIRLRAIPLPVDETPEEGDIVPPIKVVNQYETSDWDIPEVDLCSPS